MKMLTWISRQISEIHITTKSWSAREAGSIAGTVGINPRECHSGIFVGLLLHLLLEWYAVACCAIL